MSYPRQYGCCTNCGAGYSKGVQRNNGLCERCGINARQRRYRATDAGRESSARAVRAWRAKRKAREA